MSDRYALLSEELGRMRPRQKLYELVKAEMKRRGRWKNKDRGAKPPKRNNFVT